MATSITSCPAERGSQEVSPGPRNRHLHERKYPSLAEKARTPNPIAEQRRLQELRRRTAQARQQEPKRAGGGNIRSRGRRRPLPTSAPKPWLPRKPSLLRYTATATVAAASSFHPEPQSLAGGANKR
ncbi:hypothetical protein SUZIE_148185 [Sciurus carolinensis]|uniref:Uncharacterized protein n=1 Tax=Sciurus carolinensis TaxID=30640 RepID=A0AA41T015_SCICA|nr:hypothetical protein [Sciurus carolinensis]